jgi:predicted DNA-binding transcriptional regulator
MYTEIFQELGLVKNEARIYEALLIEGESSVGHISIKSKVHRRNVYDTINRLMEKGLVFEIVAEKENLYQAVHPDKLMELIQEKTMILDKIMPDLRKLYKTTPHEEEVYVYRGAEGWKNYMLDMLRVGEPVYFIAAKGGWLDERVRNFFPKFEKEAKKKKLEYFHLFDHEVKKGCPEIIPHVGGSYKFLPKGYSTTVAIDVFGDHVNIISGMKIGGLAEDFAFTVIVNKEIANAYRTWFQFMWDFCPGEV